MTNDPLRLEFAQPCQGKNYIDIFLDVICVDVQVVDIDIGRLSVLRDGPIGWIAVRGMLFFARHAEGWVGFMTDPGAGYHGKS